MFWVVFSLVRKFAVSWFMKNSVFAISARDYEMDWELKMYTDILIDKRIHSNK